ncbi:hypothetical protein ETD86_10830 [Nonomuraea turkmeniaca]|uniref:Hint domain-containing protein n=1 Tax=Nonomuraea turkmeniaca TaxID=103838 RepID=A0A5S4FPI7_9ACTN|nr:polymorphic toxin-type HINT domain-containing protein [Nonomuraea turkmeniaca]TMR22623.1 hypothetical protein ETD86_10830 [Nonomuraea turkmeniaca]
MRRILSWSRSRYAALAVAISLMPGLLVLSAQPVVAQAGATMAATSQGAPPETPKQQWGSAAGVPSLTETSVTQPAQRKAVAGAKSVASTKLPPGSLPPEERKSVVREDRPEPVVPLPERAVAESTGSERAVTSGAALMAAQAVLCSSYPQYDAGRSYSSGTHVWYASGSSRYVWWARVSVPVGKAPGSGDYMDPDGDGMYTYQSYWTQWTACEADPVPPPPPTQYPPTLTAVFPLNGMLISTRTPLFGAQAYSNMGSYPIQYAFKVCDDEALASGCVSSGSLAANASTWRVPADMALAWSKQYWWQVTATDSSNSKSTSWKGTFTTGVRQPATGSLFATPGAEGQRFQPATGNYTTSVTDAAVATVGPPLSVVRSYNSLDPRRDGMFGAGWSTRWDMKISPEVGGTLLVTFPDGRQVRFAANGTGGTFQPPPGLQATLAETRESADGPVTGWRLMDKSSTSYVFDANGRLVKIADLRGRTQNLTYGTDGKLAKVSGVGGRSLSFGWTGSHVTSVDTDPVNGQPLRWTYSYDGDKLTSVCAPVAQPNCTTYGYAGGSQYYSAVLNSDPLGYWRLGETSGQKAADSGRGAGAATYSSVTLGQAGAVEASTDKAAQLTGSGVISLPEHAIARLGDAASVEAWFKTTKTGVIMSGGTDSSSDLARSVLYVGSDGKLRGQFRPTTGTATIAPITSPGVVNDGQWHHAVLTLSGTAQQMFLDGQSVGTATGSGFGGWPVGAWLGNGRLEGGKWPAGPATTQDLPLTGHLDEVAIYDKPLSAHEVATHHAARAAAPHLMSKITLPSGRVAMQATYDAATDRIKTHTDAHGGQWQLAAPVLNNQTGISKVTVTNPATDTLVHEFDTWRGNRLVSHTDQLGKKTSYEYDTAGYPSKVTDRNGNVTTLVNDARGNVIGRHRQRSGGTGFWEWYAYETHSDPFDPRNDQLRAVNDGRSANFMDGTYASRWWFDTYGQIVIATLPPRSEGEFWGTTFTYTEGTEPAVGGGTTPAGLVQTQKDPAGSIWSYRYTSAGDLAEQTNPAGLVTKQGHDALGRVISKSEVSNAHPQGVTTTFAHDGLGRLVSQTGPGVKNEISGVTHTAQTAYTYDPDGRTLTQTHADTTGGDAARTTTYAYDDFGHLKSISDPEGGVVRQDWNTLGQLARVTDARGTVIEQAYSKRGELISKTLKGWTGSPVNPQAAKDVVLEARSYDPGGRLAARVDAMGRKTSYTYYADDLPWQTIADDVKLNGATTTRDVVLEEHLYDGAGNQTKQITGGGTLTTDATYDAANRLTSQTVDPAGVNRKTIYSYDDVSNVIKTVLTGAGSTRSEVREYGYTKTGLVNREVIENGDEDLVSVIGYDDRGLATSITDPRGNAAGADPAAYTTSYRYDAAGRLVEAKAPPVQIEKDGAAQTARPATRYGYNTVGNTTHTVDGEGRLTTSGFDRAGRLTSDTGMAYTPPGGSTITPKITYAYDTAGRLIRTTDPRGQVTSIEYDALSNAVRVTDPPASPGQSAGQWVTELDLAGEQLAAVDPTGARREATYDDLGRQITRTTIERKPTAAAFTTNLQYNDAGDLTKMTKVTASGDKITSYTVNAVGEVTTETDPTPNTTTYTYDLTGRPAKVTNAEGNATSAEYDPAGRLTGLKSLDSAGATVRTVGYGYDAADNLTQITSGEGRITRRTFDATDQLTVLIEPVSATKSITTSFGYDATGARTRLTDGRGNATWTSYNSLGLVETLTEPATTAHSNLADRTWTHLYDAAGNETALIKPGGVRLDRQFDQLNRLTKVTGSGAGIVAGDKTYGYDLADRPTSVGDHTLEYNDRSLLTKVSTPAGVSSSFAYDERGNPTQRIDATGTTTFTWDNASRLKTVADPVSGRTNTYAYDKADRLTTITSANPVNTQAYTYDALDRPLTHTLKNSTAAELAKITYGWDKDDNLTSKTTTGLAGAGSNAYGYDHAGRLTSWTSPGGTTTSYDWDDAGNRTKAGDKTYSYDERNRLLSGDGADYTYTPRGTLASQTKDGTTRTLTFDAFDRLINDRDATYTYDAFDRMSSRQSSSGQQRFAYAGLDNDIIAITDAGGIVQASYGRDPSGDLLSAKEGANPALGALTDVHQDLIGTFSGTALATTTAYNPFGEVTAQTGPKTSLGYQGEYTDPDTGTVNMHARWYQPGTGTFTNRDDWTLPASPSVQANRYTYGNANPLVHRDPNGHEPCRNVDYYNDDPMRWDDPNYDPPACTGVPGNGEAGTRGDVDREPRSEPRQGNPQNTNNGPSTGNKGTSGKGTPQSGQVSQSISGPALPPTQKHIDYQCAHGPCKGSYGGHENIFTGPVHIHAGPTSPSACSFNCTSSPAPSNGTPTVAPVDLPSDGPLPPAWTPPFQPPDFWQAPLDSAMGIFQGAWDMTCFVCHFVPGFSDLPQLPIQSLFGTDPTSPEYQTGYWGIHILSMFIAPETGAFRPRNVPRTGGWTARNPCLNSFAPGTQVLMANGTQKNIEDIEIGDEVLATKPETGETAPETVTAIHRNLDTAMTDVTIKSVDGRQSTLHTTMEHPFWESGRKEWVDAGDLQPKDLLRSTDGRRAAVVKVHTFDSARWMYNLTVDDVHTYHVVAGDQAVLVHNADPGCADKLRRGLIGAGFPEPSTPHSPHHIVAGNSPRAAPARAVLDKFGIGVNDAENGVWLPRSSGSPNPTGASVHSRIHTNDYYDHVNKLMSGARTRGEALDVIDHIRKQLQGGYWP